MDRIGPYTVVRELARGGMGVVYHALAPQGQPVAVKVLHSVTAAQQARLLREGQALLRLDHPNVVRVHDVGQDRGRPFLAMDLVEGETLQRRLDRQGPLRPRVAADLARRLALALEHAHERGVVHRDVKPGNVILQAITGDPLLTDFGLARPLEQGATRLTQSGVMLGTLGYAAPEQLLGDAERAGPAADIWGLGATLYAALSGSAPFDGDSAVEVVVATQERAPRRPSDHQKGLPQALEEICLRCLEKSPADRFASAGELAQALAAWLEGDRAQPARRRPRAAIAAIAAVAACVVVVAVGVGLSATSPPAQEPPAVATTTVTPTTTLAPRAPEPAPAAVSPAEAARVALLRADALLEAGDRRGALAFLDEALRLTPDDAATLALRSGVRVRLKDLDGALADAERALEIDPVQLDALMNRGAVHGNRAEHALAAADLEQAVAIAPDRPTAWSDLANAYAGLERLDDALRAADRAVSLAPDLPSALATRGWVRVRRREPGEARPDLDRALQLDPEDADTWSARAMARAQLNDLTGAVEDWSRATELDPGLVDSWTNCASARMSLRDFAGAVRDCTRALEVQATHFPAYFNRGLAQRNLGELAASEADFDRAIALDPERGEGYLQRGVTRARAGKLDLARADGSRAVSLLEQQVAPDHPWIQRARQLRDDPQSVGQ